MGHEAARELAAALGTVSAGSLLGRDDALNLSADKPHNWGLGPWFARPFAFDAWLRGSCILPRLGLRRGLDISQGR